MNLGFQRLVVVSSILLLVVTGISLQPVGAQIPGVPQFGAEGCSSPGVDDRCEQWAASYHDPEIAADSSQFPSGATVSVDGEMVFAAITNTHGSGFDTRSRWSILGYAAHSGEQVWETKWGDPDRYSFPSSIVAGRDPSLVFVSGSTRTEFSDPDGRMKTFALAADTGEIVWEAAYNGPGGTDNSRTMTTSPDGRSVYVATISSGSENHDLDYVLVAYDALTGAELFTTRYKGIDINDVDTPWGIVVSPSGDLVYLTGQSAGPGEFNIDFATIAVAATGPTRGTIVWEARYDGTGVSGPDSARDITVAPDGSRVYVTGYSNEAEASAPFAVNYYYATVAYDAATGEQLWEARRGFEGTNFNASTAIAADRAGRVFITGQSKQQSPADFNIATVAYDGATGQELWFERYGLELHDHELGMDIAVSPRSDGVYVTGISSSSHTKALYGNQTQNGDHITMGYDPETGARDFTARYNATGYDYDVGRDAVVSPDGSMLYLTSSLKHNVELDRNFSDAGLIAYNVGEAVSPPEETATTTTFTDDSENSAQHSDQAFFEATVTDEDGAPIENAQVTFTLSGPEGSRNFGATTDESGTASVSPTIEERPGTYDLTASYAGSPGTYSGSEDAASFAVLKENTDLVLSLNGRGNKQEASARLSDRDAGSGISERTIEFFADGESIGSAITDGDGGATVSVPPGSRGNKVTFEANFGGDDFYEASSDDSSTEPGPPPRSTWDWVSAVLRWRFAVI